MNPKHIMIDLEAWEDIKSIVPNMDHFSNDFYYLNKAIKQKLIKTD
ncbi:MAG TPA: hypothetical protein VK553_10725 [Candidatus Nitrosopolaris rasttigaisensis]|nr:hypothetical protein [Candidatus Nitrosopolaris rasttigaisensis]